MGGAGYSRAACQQWHLQMGLLGMESRLGRLGRRKATLRCSDQILLIVMAGLQAALAQRDSLRTELASAQQAQREQQAQWGAERAVLEQKLAGAAQALCGSEGSMHSSRSAAQVLQVSPKACMTSIKAQAVP